ncbi:hypothetical protein MSAN_00276100 [Mycena sanguinolenta]|uniref:Uncharacterized protein n=1 Tax=Mycena sanguinolenta TaxID=230812 RepID=A0A8H6ZJF5_9AGAR|nr:hypothetical protein MSAN_00276100 [Mycena sanguinolenta]
MSFFTLLKSLGVEEARPSRRDADADPLSRHYVPSPLPFPFHSPFPAQSPCPRLALVHHRSQPDLDSTPTDILLWQFSDSQQIWCRLGFILGSLSVLLGLLPWRQSYGSIGCGMAWPD